MITMTTKKSILESLVLTETKNTPSVHFNAKSGLLEITGRSIPEHPSEFYEKLITWLDIYVNEPHKHTLVRMRFDYFNTSSSKCILDMLKKVSKINQAEHTALVEWICEQQDEEMKEAGVDFMELIKIPFSIIVTG